MEDGAKHSPRQTRVACFVEAGWGDPGRLGIRRRSNLPRSGLGDLFHLKLEEASLRSGLEEEGVGVFHEFVVTVGLQHG